MQHSTSANTSINSSKLPAIFRKINFLQLYCDYIDHSQNHRHGNPTILDYGAGKYTKIIRDFCKNRGVKYVAYDKYNGSDSDWDKCAPDLIICSNVLNVIDDEQVMKAVHDAIIKYKCPYLITVYEGSKNNLGRKTKNDCYQRNEPIKNYKYLDEIIYKSVITKTQYKNYIK